MTKKKTTTKAETKTSDEPKDAEAPAVVRTPGDGSRMLSAAEVAEIAAAEKRS